MRFIPTFHCNGHCLEVIDLYKQAFGLVVDWQGTDDSTGRIYHTEAHIGEQSLRLSDGPADRDTKLGESLFLAVTLGTVEEAKSAFNVLKVAGKVIQEPHKTEFASCMSELIDQFGFKWFIMVD